ncbi:MAG: glycosyltransferase family 4 protein [Patescibacteria group bacterium]
MANQTIKKILWLNWKDIYHPDAGGAEKIQHEICRRLVQNGYEVTLLTSIYPDAAPSGKIDGYQVLRMGNAKSTHTFLARSYFSKHLKNQFDLIVEEVNTAPYLIKSVSGNEKVVIYYNQLAREIWFHLLKFPLNLIGFVFLEPIATWIQALLQRRNNLTMLAISESTKQDIARFGFKKDLIKIFSMGIDNQPLANLTDSASKETDFTVLFHSSLRAMKQPMEVFKAFNLVHKTIPEAKLWISGGGDQTELKQFAQENNFDEKVIFFGRTSDSQKLELMQKATVLCSTSIKEGWGLIVTEANSMGTPAIVYDADGLRDSAAAGGNWVVPKNNSEALAQKLIELNSIFKNQTDEYETWRQQVWQKSKLVNYDQCYNDFVKYALEGK